MADTASTKSLFQSFILIVLGVALVPVVASLAADANLTGSTGTIISLVPLLFVITIVYGQAKHLL